MIPINGAHVSTLQRFEPFVIAILHFPLFALARARASARENSVGLPAFSIRKEPEVLNG